MLYLVMELPTGPKDRVADTYFRLGYLVHSVITERHDEPRLKEAQAGLSTGVDVQSVILAPHRLIICDREVGSYLLLYTCWATPSLPEL